MQILKSIRYLALIALIGALPYTSFPQVAIWITVAPPELPVYEQPLCPAANYMWIPGYWAWAGPDGYYWVSGGVGNGAGNRPPVDPGLLGLEYRPLLL
jgi:WXXGXW repeat (2 copies)